MVNMSNLDNLLRNLKGSGITVPAEVEKAMYKVGEGGEKEKPLGTHVVLTGRNAKEELIAAADLVTEMRLVKHPFRDGIKAQKGIEF